MSNTPKAFGRGADGINSILDEMERKPKTPEGRYGLGKRVEFRVKPVTRYVVTKWERDIEPEGQGSAGGPTHIVTNGGAEFDNHETAYAVAYALCRAEHERLGYPPFDDRIQYPRQNEEGETLTPGE